MSSQDSLSWILDEGHPTYQQHRQRKLEENSGPRLRISDDLLQWLGPNSVEGELCPICQTEIEWIDRTVKHPACRSLYHDKCLLPWLAEKLTCPMCRAPLRRHPDIMSEEERAKFEANRVYEKRQQRPYPSESHVVNSPALLANLVAPHVSDV
jgi:endogenous inhibitor of DNA gyrase (YacG/DUF329 family)